MRAIRLATLSVVVCVLLPSASLVAAQNSNARKEMKRADFSGAPGLEVVSSINEHKIGEVAARHFQHGVEAAYVMQGSIIQLPGKEPTTLEAGAVILNLRHIAHGGFKVVDEKPLRLFTVHIVEKGKPASRLEVTQFGTSHVGFSSNE